MQCLFRVQKYFLENLWLASFLCWRDISRDLFVEKTLTFFSYMRGKAEKSSLLLLLLQSEMRYLDK